MNAPEQSILQYLRKNGQRLDAEIAEATGIPLPAVRSSIGELTANGEVTHCSVIRFGEGRRFEGLMCRVSGMTPPKAPGPKPQG